MTTATATPAAGGGVPVVTFIDKLMEPLPAAELADPKLKRLEQIARREAKERHRKVWNGSMALVEMAHHKHRALFYQWRAHRDGTWPEAPDEGDRSAAWNAWGEAIDRQMQIPAMTRYDLKWKKQYERVAVTRRHVGKATIADFVEAVIACVEGDKELAAREKARADAIAADEARLAKRPKG